MSNVVSIGAALAALGYILVGLPLLTGMLLRRFIRHASASRVALLAALLVTAVQLPGVPGPGKGSLLSDGLVDQPNLVGAWTIRLSLFLVLGNGLAFICARWGVDIADRRRNEAGGTRQ